MHKRRSFISGALLLLITSLALAQPPTPASKMLPSTVPVPPLQTAEWSAGPTTLPSELVAATQTPWRGRAI